MLTPIRGSTAFSDDFVLLPSSRAVETGTPDNIAPSPGERCESPGPTIDTLSTDSEAHYTIVRDLHATEDASEDSGPVFAPEPEPQPQVELEPQHEPKLAPELEPNLELKSEFKPRPEHIFQLEAKPESEPEPEPEPEFEDSTTPLAHSFTSETRTITNTIVGICPEDIPQIPAMPLASQPKEVAEQPSVDEILAAPVPKGVAKFVKPVITSPPSPVKLSTPIAEPQRNIIPFPSDSDIEIARHDTPTRTDTRSISLPLEPYQDTNAAWVVSAWQTAAGIMLIAAECWRWLARKGLRDDFRSCMSCWFLKELVIGLVLPLFLAPAALWLLFRTMYLHHDSSPVHL